MMHRARLDALQRRAGAVAEALGVKAQETLTLAWDVAEADRDAPGMTVAEALAVLAPVGGAEGMTALADRLPGDGTGDARDYGVLVALYHSAWAHRRRSRSGGAGR